RAARPAAGAGGALLPRAEPSGTSFAHRSGHPGRARAGAGGLGNAGGARLSGRGHPPAHRAEGNRPAADNVFLCTWGGVSGRTGGGDAGNTSMTAPFFVTATGTDSGKTHILCALL